MTEEEIKNGNNKNLLNSKLDYPDIFYVTLQGGPNIQLWRPRLEHLPKGPGDADMVVQDLSKSWDFNLRFLGTKWIPLPKVSGLLPFECV